ncbi:SusC/RagA family TonB-linked outer membrane protein [Pedobacter sp. MW01-1-1]|uniref:SusC/RagA family TonB-linked outer membrane protein n=1 Tax=Pedobacter sp. MW01-1-1 TaxID=3383027 RepID=UPI003FEE522B
MIKKVLLSLVLVSVFYNTWAQDNKKEVKGTITSSADNQPLQGVSVSILKTKNSTLSNSQGDYSIKASLGDTLVFKYVGYQTRRFIFKGNNSIINIKLTEAVGELDQVVVIGYGTVKKRDVTGAISSLKAEDLVDATAVSFADAMRGKAAGVMVTSSSGEPGASVNIKIRGNNSISASSNPLYVIDGVPIEDNSNEIYAGGAPQSTTVGNPLASLDPSNIESIEILKDASAAAIYGSRGANGVILITTKTPKINEPSFTFSSTVSYSTFKKLDVLGAADYAQYMTKVDPTNPLYVNQTTGAPISYADSTTYNWQDLLSQNPINQNYSLGLAKVTDKTNYFVSLGYNSTDGLIKESNFSRYSLLFNLNSDLTNKLKLEVRMNTGYTILDGQISGSGFGGNAGLVNRMLLTRPTNINIPDDEEEDLLYNNPLTYLEHTTKTYNTFRNNLNTNISYKLAKGLTLKVSGGGYITYSDNTTFIGKDVAQGKLLNGRAILGSVKTINFLNENTLNYNTVINKKHRLTALAGVTFQQNTNSSNFFETNDFPVEVNGPDAVQAGLSVSNYNSNKQRWSLLSYLGRFNYTFNNKYILTASLRADGSSKFQGKNKFALFPAAALSWQLGEEQFIKNLNTFDLLKLRLSYGSIGNQSIPAYSSLGVSGYVDYYGGTTMLKGLSAQSVSNTDLKWETSTTLNLGLDMALFKNRLNFTAEVYNKDTKNLLLYAPIPASSGYEKIYRNVGSLNNKGLELTIGGIIIDGKSFKWDASFNFSTNENKITDLGSQSLIPFGNVAGSSSSESINVLKVGSSSTSLYGYIFDGLYQASDFNSTGGLLTGVPSFGSPAPGNMKFKDLSGPNGEPDGIINSYDLTIIGNATPKNFGGLRNTFSYKNLKLSVFIAYQYGNDIENWNMFHVGGRTTGNLFTDLYRNSWTPTNTDTTVPILSDNTGKAVASSYYVQDGSFIRLQNLQLSYSLASKICKKLGMSAASITASADNLVLFTNYKYGYDPEITSNNQSLFGIDFFNYPRPTSYSLGLNIKF